jgi:hypothetical protein
MMRPAGYLAVLLLLGACAQIEQFLAAPPSSAAAETNGSVSPRRQPDDVIAYLGTLRGMNEAAVNREVARQRQVVARDSSDIARTRLALALTLSALGEDQEILSLVEPVARKESGRADVRAMASFLQAMVGERRRLRESAAAANARSRDDRRAADAQKQRADGLQERAAQLQQKLDALTELEKSLSDRQTNR